MVVYKRKKNTRQRAGTTHGWGSMKKHRGAGHRGGRGNAGSGKRGDAKKPSLLWEKGKKKVGKYGFKLKSTPIKVINISLLEQRAPNIGKDDVVKIDLKKAKFDKLLGLGKVTHKYEIIVNSASEKAIAKIEKAGGKIILPKPKQKKEESKE